MRNRSIVVLFVSCFDVGFGAVFAFCVCADIKFG